MDAGGAVVEPRGAQRGVLTRRVVADDAGPLAPERAVGQPRRSQAMAGPDRRATELGSLEVVPPVVLHCSEFCSALHPVGSLAGPDQSSEFCSALQREDYIHSSLGGIVSAIRQETRSALSETKRLQILSVSLEEKITGMCDFQTEIADVVVVDCNMYFLLYEFVRL